MLRLSWTTVISVLLLLLTSINCSSSSGNTNSYLAKTIIEKHGQKFINLYAFPQLKITLKTLDPNNFVFQTPALCNGGSNCHAIPVKAYFSTGSSEKVRLRVDKEEFNLELSSNGRMLKHDFNAESHSINLKYYYDRANLNFIKDSNNNFLIEITAEHTLVDGLLFYISLPSSVILQESSLEPPPPVTAVTIPPDYEMCDGSKECELLKDELGVKFASKGSLAFALALLTKENTYEVVQSFDANSPIYTLAGPASCSTYKLKLSFGETGSISFDRKIETIEIKTDFESVQRNIPSASINRESNIQFYFYKKFIFFYFYDPQDGFQMRTLDLQKERTESSTKLKIDVSSGIIRECETFNKLEVVGENVKMLLPKAIQTTSTLPPPLPSENQTTPETVAKKEDDSSEEAAIPLVVIIVLSCFGGLILLCAIILVIYCCIKHYKKRNQPKSPTTTMLDPSISMMEQNEALFTKQPPAIVATKVVTEKKPKDDKIPIIVGATTSSLAPKNDEKALAPMNDEKVLPKNDIKNDQKKDAENGNVKKTAEDDYDKIPPPIIIKPPPPPPEFKPEVKAVRFDKEFVRSVLPAKVFEVEKYYEENPIEDETIEWNLVPQKITICTSQNFWDLFPFLKSESASSLEVSDAREYQFLIRDLSLPENKVFHKFGARLAEPVDEEVIEEGADGQRLEALVIKTFILSHDPPTIELIVHNDRQPYFFYFLTKCRTCRIGRAVKRIRYFTSPADLSTCLRELPLGHHVFAAIGEEREIATTKNRKTVYVVKGGRQSIPVNLTFGAYAHRNRFHIGPAKKKHQKKAITPQQDSEKVIATLNSRENNDNKKTAAAVTKTKTETLDGDAAATKTAPTQNTAENNNRDGGATARTQPSVTE